MPVKPPRNGVPHCQAILMDSAFASIWRLWTGERELIISRYLTVWQIRERMAPHILGALQYESAAVEYRQLRWLFGDLSRLLYPRHDLRCGLATE
jgi:hypothetical protein